MGHNFTQPEEIELFYGDMAYDEKMSCLKQEVGLNGEEHVQCEEQEYEFGYDDHCTETDNLMNCINFGIALKEVCGPEMELTDTEKQCLLSHQQQLALIHLVKENDPDAKMQVINHNLRSIANIAKRYAHHGVNFLDIFREGVIGFIHALRNFELEGGFRFAAYAARCVRQNIELVIMNQKNHLTFPLQYKRTVLGNN